MEDFKFNLGSEVKDKITGFKGIVRGRTQYLTGCNIYGLQSQKLTKEGKPDKWEWIDEDQIILVRDKKIVIYEKTIIKKTGGPNSIDQYPPT